MLSDPVLQRRLEVVFAKYGLTNEEGNKVITDMFDAIRKVMITYDILCYEKLPKFYMTGLGYFKPFYKKEKYYEFVDKHDKKQEAKAIKKQREKEQLETEGKWRRFLQE